MNTMEDKELKELFEAKRTVEANRRRQEALRQLLEAKAAQEKKSRVLPLWPVWAGAAAAAVAVIMLMVPFLNHPAGNTTAVVVAQTEVPEIDMETEESVPQADTPQSTTIPATSTMTPQRQTQKMPATVPAAEEATEEPMDAPLEQVAPVTEESVIPEEPLQKEIIESTAPRVLRRQSTIIACTDGCITPEGSAEKTSHLIQIDLSGNDNFADANGNTFVINK